MNEELQAIRRRREIALSQATGIEEIELVNTLYLQELEAYQSELSYELGRARAFADVVAAQQWENNNDF